MDLPAPQGHEQPFLAGGGELGRLIRVLPWGLTPLGSPDAWPENLRTLVRVMLSSRQPMFIAWGPERIMLYNDGYAPLCGGKHPWALGKPFAEVWADILEAVAPIMDAAYRGVPTTMDDIQFTMLRNGYPEEAHFSFGYTPVHDDATGNVAGMFCTCLEITAEVLAGRERQAEVERLRELFAQAPGAVGIVSGLDHVFAIANSAYLRMIGHRPVIGNTVASALPEMAEQGFVALLDRVRASGEPFVGQAVPVGLQLKPDGPIEERLLNFVYQPIKDAAGTVTGIFMEATDVSDQVRAAAKIQADNERLELALSAGNGVGTWDWDVAADRVTADARFANLYGVDPALAEGGAPIAAFFENIHPEDFPRVEAEVAQAIRTRKIFTSEYRLLQADGSIRRVIAQGRCDYGADGKPSRFPGVSFDITERKDAEDAVRHAKDEREFVLALTAAQRTAPSSDEVMRLTAERIGRRLRVNRVGFYRMMDEDTLLFGPGWSDGVLPLREGRLAIASLGPHYLATLRAGEVFAFGDVQADPGVDAHTVGWRGTRSGVNVPFVRAGRWEAGLYLSGTAPRSWRGEDIALVEEAAQLSWDAVERARAESLIRRRAALLELGDRLRDLTDPADLAYAAGETLARTLGVARAGYGSVDAAAETVTIERDWQASGIVTLAGTVHLRRHGTYVEDLKRGATVIVPDVRADARTAPTAHALEALDMRAFVDMPITENGRLVALLYLDHPEPRTFSEEEIAFMREVAERTRLAIERRRAEAELEALNLSLERRIEERTMERNLLATILETTDAFVQVVDPNFRWLAINKASAREFEHIFGVRPKAGDSMLELLHDRPEHQAAVKAVWGRALAGEEFTEVAEFGDPARARRAYEMKFNTLRDKDGATIGAYQFVYDVTVHMAAQKRLAEAEEQVRQMQKMEAVGQLTGGIAHDFNNMMAVVIGGLNLLQRRLARGDTNVERYIDGAMDGANRAAALTQRLLAFSRQQPLAPEAVDANQLISSMLDLLNRTLGENVRIETKLAPELWRTQADPGQLENALINLSVNARDAMPEGGRLTIATANADLDGAQADAEKIAPGAYVLITVSDTGTGMAPDVIEKAFDPFFTTKGVGKGTGLGLSQVFGFIRQSGGHVTIASEVGKGTAVRVFLPRFSSEDVPALPKGRALSAEGARAGEIVMVVEDEERVRAFSVDALRELGYAVVETESAPDALRRIESGQDVTLLFTDVVMPEMTGPQLAELALRKRPALKVLFTTGYARNALAQDAIDPGTSFLPKPFGIEQLAAKVRSVLDGN